MATPLLFVPTGKAGNIESEWAMFGDRYRQAKRCAAVAVTEAKTGAWEVFGEALENDFREGEAVRCQHCVQWGWRAADHYQGCGGSVKKIL